MYKVISSLYVKIKLIITSVFILINNQSKKNYDVVFIKRDAIGDFIIWAGYAQKLRRFYKNRKITLICSSKNYEIAKLLNIADELIVFDSYVHDIKKLVSFRCNIIISPTISRDVNDELIARTISAEQKIAIEGDSVYNPFYDVLNSIIIYDKVINLEEKNLPDIQNFSRFYNYLTSSNERIIFADLEAFRNRAPIAEPYFVVNLGASLNFKRWPVERFVEVSQHIYDVTHWTCVLIGSKKEQPLSKQFSERFNGVVRELTGKTTLKELIAVINHAQFSLTNDTSTVHICAACDKKCFSIVSGMHYGRFTGYPEVDNRRNLPCYIYSYSECFGCRLEYNSNKMRQECKNAFSEDTILPCVSMISVQDVWNVVKKNIEQDAQRTMSV